MNRSLEMPVRGISSRRAPARSLKKTLPSSLLATLRRLGSAIGELWDGIERRHGFQGGRPRDVTERRHLSQVRQRSSGLYRIPFVQPCHVQGVAERRDAKICDLSAGGVYIALEPVPDVGPPRSGEPLNRPPRRNLAQCLVGPQGS